jgi:rubredoxin
VVAMIDAMREQADNPPDRLKVMPDSYFDELERVDKKDLKKDWVCPICSNAFTEGRCFP